MMLSKHRLYLGNFRSIDVFANFIQTLYKLELTTATDVAMRNVEGGGYEIRLTGEKQ